MENNLSGVELLDKSFEDGTSSNLSVRNIEPTRHIPDEKYLYLFPGEWDFFLKDFDDKIISIFQTFHLKKKTKSTLNTVIGFIFMCFSFLVTCSHSLNIIITY